jgi:hypothetical protein
MAGPFVYQFDVRRKLGRPACLGSVYLFLSVASAISASSALKTQKLNTERAENTEVAKKSSCTREGHELSLCCILVRGTWE